MLEWFVSPIYWLMITEDQGTQVEFTIYTKDGCGYCAKAKELLNKRGFVSKQIEITDENKDSIYKKIDKLTDNYRYFPIVFEGEKFLGGYTELSAKYPESDGGEVTIPTGTPTKQNNFKGTPSSSLKCMKYLAEKHDNACVVIPDTWYPMEHKDISLRWIEEDGAISVPKDFWNLLKKCNGRKRFKIFPFGFTCTKGDGHANYMIYDSKTKSLERYEPLGLTFSKCITLVNLDNEIKKLFDENMGKNFIKKYYKPLDYLPKDNVQRLQMREEAKEGDPSGFCVAWVAWWADLRLSNPNIDRKGLSKIVIKEIAKMDQTDGFTDFIRDYASNLDV